MPDDKIEVPAKYRIHPSNVRELNQETLASLFTFHPPTGDQPERYIAIRAAADVFARVIIKNCPGCADRTVAIRKLREVVMTANASIALEPQEDES